MSNKLFTVVIIHYNQIQYMRQAIDSVLKQTYPHIELIFADDATKNINKEEIELYIRENKNDNIRNFCVRINEENIGTVRNLNDAIRMSRGEYILFFAADDELYDENVISKYVEGFAKIPKDRLVLSSQCLMYDRELKEETGKFVNPAIAFKANEYSAEEQNKMLFNRSSYAVGATAFKRETFEKWGMFDETYKVIEDWSYTLAITRKGGTIFYSDFNGLKHRAGGISEYDEADEFYTPSHVSNYREDLMKIYEIEILPNLSRVHKFKRIEIFKQYKAIKGLKSLTKILILPSLLLPAMGIAIDKMASKARRTMFKYGVLCMLAYLVILPFFKIMEKNAVPLFAMQPLNTIIKWIMNISGVAAVVFLCAFFIAFLISFFRKLYLTGRRYFNDRA